MFDKAQKHYQSELEGIRQSGLWKEERVIDGPQGVRISVKGRKDLLNMCANNYLG